MTRTTAWLVLSLGAGIVGAMFAAAGHTWPGLVGAVVSSAALLSAKEVYHG